MRRALLAAAVCAALPASASAYRPSGERWPGRPAVITYFNATRYADAVGRAAGAWNSSGARVRFVAASRRHAQLQIGYGRDLSIDSGFASVGRERANFVHLSRAGGGSLMVEVIAHELGHVLGLAHETRRCAAMNPTSWERCASPPPCSVLQADDVRGAIHRYGGKARRRAGVFCPPAPRWPSVTNMDGGADVRFTLPSNPFVTGYMTAFTHDRCPTLQDVSGPPDGALPGETRGIGLRATDGPGDYCLAVWSAGDYQRRSRTPLLVRFTL